MGYLELGYVQGTCSFIYQVEQQPKELILNNYYYRMYCLFFFFLFFYYVLIRRVVSVSSFAFFKCDGKAVPLALNSHFVQSFTPP
jgi:hypothetical protein